MKSRLSVLFLTLLCLAPAVVVGQSYTFDPDGRLTSAFYPSGQATVYGYDAAGNITSVATFADRDRDGMHDAWEIQFYGSTAVGDPEADGDHDGLVTLAEFALGRRPDRADAAGVATLTVRSEAAGSYIEFAYRRAKLGTYFNDYEVETSPDLKVWSSDPAQVRKMGEEGLDADTEELRFRILAPFAGGKGGNGENGVFVRVKISPKS